MGSHSLSWEVSGRRVYYTHSRMALIPCIAISTGYILLVLFLCELARKLIAPLNPGLVKTALNEAIAAADLCGVCFELIIVADNYGLAAYGLYLFLATWWWSLHWGDATACAYNHFESYIEGTMTKQEVIVRVIGQVIGGVAVFRLNPILATGLKFGCRGHTPMEFFVVYWIGSSLGAISSIYSWPHIEEAIKVKTD